MTEVNFRPIFVKVIFFFLEQTKNWPMNTYSHFQSQLPNNVHLQPSSDLIEELMMKRTKGWYQIEPFSYLNAKRSSFFFFFYYECQAT